MTNKAQETLLLRFVSGGPEETLKIGKIIGENVKAGDMVALIGELGSGKTLLTQGIAQGIPVSEGYHITSPTFTLINEYPGRINLYHLDVYRLAGSEDLALLGFEDYIDGDGVVVIEWAEKIRDILPEESLFVRLCRLDDRRREICVEGNVRRFENLFKALKDGGGC